MIALPKRVIINLRTGSSSELANKPMLGFCVYRGQYISVFKHAAPNVI